MLRLIHNISLGGTKNLQNVVNHIKKGEFKNIYLLCGEEEYTKNASRNLLVENILKEPVEGNMNYHYFSGSSINIPDLLEQADCLPFFSERQLIVVNSSGFFKTNNTLAESIENMPESTFIIFIESAIDKRNALYKFVKKNGMIFEFNHKNDRELVMWIARYLNKYDYKITGRAANLIISRVGQDMTSISNELEKLIAYTADTKTIDTDEVKAICSVSLSNKIFSMMDYIVSGKGTEALSLYRDLVLAKEAPPKILALLSRHYNILAQIKDMPRESDMNIAKALSIPSFAVKKYKSQAGMYNRSEILSCITACIEAETSFKTGLINPQIAIEVLIIQLSQMV